MRSECSKAALLSALMITALLVPLTVVNLTLAGSSTTAEPTGSPAPLYIDPDNYHVILHGKDTMYQEDNPATPAPEKVYELGDNPPIMAGKKIENGAVVAFAGIGTFRGGPGYRGAGPYPGWVRWKLGEFDVFMDYVFKWLRPGTLENRDNILWFQGYGVYHNYSVCQYFIDNMNALYNYKIVYSSSTPITSSLLAPYDILVIPQLQLGAGATGGDPSQLPDADVAAIENFVKRGGGLFIMEGSDYATYNFYKVQNKILAKFGFLYRFQSDDVSDNVNCRESNNPADDPPYNYLPVVDVDNETWIGDNYESATGENEVGLYAAASLRGLVAWGVSMTTESRYQNCLPGTKVTFKVKVVNMSDLNYDNFALTVSDNLGWCSTDNLDDNLLGPVENTKTATATLTVKVPDNAPYRTMDNIKITATSRGDNTKKDIFITSIYVCTWIMPPTDDVQAVQGDLKENSPQGAMGYMYVGSGDPTTKFQNERSYLKFDLGDGLPSGYTIENARLYLYCFTTMGPTGNIIQVYGLDNDNWSEVDLVWTKQPAGALTWLDNENVVDNRVWYSWDVTSFIKPKYPTDNIVSFLVKAAPENRSPPDNFSYGFDAKEYSSTSLHPYLAFGVRPVASYITENHGLPGETVTVKAVIRNGGAVVDNYDVKIENTSPGWIVSPSATTENNVQQGENRTVGITVTIPGTAEPGTWQNLTVTVTSKKDNKYSSSTTEYGVFVEFAIHAVPGWNLVGFPYGDTGANFFPGLNYYDNYYLIYWKPPYAGYGYDLDETSLLKDNMGYWLKIEGTENVTVRMRGTPPENREIHLVGPGWNLVSFPVVNENTTIGNVFAGLNYYENYYLIYWKPPYGGYGYDLDETSLLKDNLGYWVFIDQNWTVTVP